jgi:hypothetical protein
MGLFGSKAIDPAVVTAHPAPPQYQQLLALGTPLIERDNGAGASYTFHDPDNGRSSKYLFDLWGIGNLLQLDEAVASLVERSRDLSLIGDRDKANQAVLRRYKKAMKKAPVTSLDYSAARVASVADFGACHLEYAAMLLRHSLAFGYAPADEIFRRLQAVHGEVATRFANWNDYMISADKSDQVDTTFGFPDGAPAYLRLAADPAFAFARFPLH